MFFRQFRFLGLLLVILTTTGCASNIDVAPKLSAQTNVNPQEGILLARVVNTTSYQLPMNKLYVAPKEVNASEQVKTVLAPAEDKPVGGSTLFAVSLKPGEYSLSSVVSLVFRGEFYYTRGAPADPEFGVFTVEAGKVTDLGTIIYYPKPQDDRYRDILIRVPETANGQLLQRYFPQFVTEGQEVLTWHADERDEQRFLTYASAAQNPVDFSEIIEAPDGSIYLLGKLGVILHYSPDEGFETLAVDTDLALNTFAQNQAGDRVVGGHEGALYFQAVNEDWQAIDLPQKATVHHVVFYLENQFDVVYSIDKNVFIYRYDTADLDRSQQLNVFSHLNKWKNEQTLAPEASKVKPVSSEKRKPREINTVSLSESNDQKLINISTIKPGSWTPFDTGKIETFRYSPDDWEMGPAKEDDQKMDAIFNAGAVELGIERAGFWSWSGKPSFYIRTDENASWQELTDGIKACKDDAEIRGNLCVVNNKSVGKVKTNSFSFISTPWFWDNESGLAVVSFSDYSFWTGERSSETKILLTDDGGLSWQTSELSLPKEYCTTIVGQVKDRILLSCDGATTDFYESTDKGQSWQHIRQQQAF